MAKKTNKQTQSAPPVTYRDGRWITVDGLCFNTATKAYKHIKDLETKTNNNGTIE